MPNPREVGEMAHFYHYGPDCENNNRKKISEAFKRERRRHDPASPDNEWRFNHWKKHRNRVAKAGAIVDCSSPSIHPFNVTRSHVTYNKRLRAHVRIEIENALFTKHLEEIVKGKNQLDNELSSDLRRINHNAKSRFNQQLKVTRENCAIARSLVSVQPTMSRRKQLEWYNKQELCMERLAKFPLFWKNRLCQETFAVTNASDYHKPTVFFDLQFKHDQELKKTGRIIIELHSRAAPIAVENFRSLCKENSFKCCKVDKIWPGMYYKLGSGAQGSHNGPFPPQKFKMKHDEAGIVSLVNNGENLFDAEFMITARELKPLDGQNLAIGKVLKGMNFLQSLDELVKPHSGSTYFPIYIVQTGELTPEEMKHELSQSSSGNLEEEE